MLYTLFKLYKAEKFTLYLRMQPASVLTLKSMDSELIRWGKYQRYCLQGQFCPLEQLPTPSVTLTVFFWGPSDASGKRDIGWMKSSTSPLSATFPICHLPYPPLLSRTYKKRSEVLIPHFSFPGRWACIYVIG